MTRIPKGGVIPSQLPVIQSTLPVAPVTQQPAQIGQTDSFTQLDSPHMLQGATLQASQPAQVGATSVEQLRLQGEIAAKNVGTLAHTQSTNALYNPALQQVTPQLQELLSSQPSIRSNMDLLNHAFLQGGQTLEGAESFVANLGLDFNALFSCLGGQLRQPTAQLNQESVLGAVTRNNPSLQSNQDLINFAYKNGGNSFEGAAAYLKEMGVDINQLVASREAPISGGAPSTNTMPPPAMPTFSPQDKLAGITRQHPELQSNQDLINLAYKMGGGNFEGATAYLQNMGIDIQSLVANREGALPTGPSPLQQLVQQHPVQSNQDFLNLAVQQGGGTLEGAASFAAQHGVSIDDLMNNREAAFDPNGAVETVAPMAPPMNVPTEVTPAQLRQIVPHMSASRAEALAPHINRAMAEANINTPARKAAFIAQIAHESDGFRTNEEYASGAAYEGRRDLGNTQPGDGRRFKGRGFIQLTGRSNYTRASQDLGVDLVSNPQYAETNEGAARVTAWYWNENNLNRYADSGDFVTLTRRINGGTNGLADRQRYFARARQVFGA